MKRKAISIFMVLVLTVCTVFSTGFTNVNAKEKSQSAINDELKYMEATGQLAALRELKESIGRESMYKEDDEVVIIVELEDKTLIDCAGEDQTISEYAASPAGKNARKKIIAKHTQIKNIIKDEVKGVSYEDSQNYTSVMNGFTVKAKYGDLKAINEIEGVKCAFVDGYYDMPITEKIDEPNMKYSTGTIGSATVNADGYTGKGTVVAVLDTGLDYNHEAFIVSPEELKYTQEQMNEKISANGLNGVVRNNKVIYSYDYADKDTDVMPVESKEHGTHVAGTVAGNNGDDFFGVAPDAQLMIMKVFSDGSEGASGADQIAALEDAITLGADAINMSLGSPCGFTEGSDEVTRDVYKRIGEAGISLMISAGNSYQQSYNLNNYNLPYADTPDYGTVGSPSTYDTSLSVASIDNTMITEICIKVGDNNYIYIDNGPTDMKLIKLAGQTYEYVHVGMGLPEDYVGKDVAGKVALIVRGGTTFSEKVANAASNGAVAAIIYNNTAGTISMSVEEYFIPAVSILKADGDAMVAAEDKRVTFTDKAVSVSSPTANEMSDFSSWGVTPSLTLKPEITAPGGDIYSTVPGNKYESMGGTSMAAPHMAGAAAVLRQYVNENFDMTNVEERDFINNVLMSTANPVEEPDGGYYSPRKQGAGIVNVYDAINAGAYLYTGDNDRPKAEMGDSEEGCYEFSFFVKNYSDQVKTYNLLYQLQSSYPASDGEMMYDTLSNLSFGAEDANVAITINGQEASSITVEPGMTSELHVSIELTEDTINFLNNYFKNGAYVEGFLFLDSENDVEDLSMPMIGFLGDWEGLDLFDGTVYDDNYYYSGSMVKSMFEYNDKTYYDILGSNYFTGALDKNNIAYSKNRIRNEYGIDTDAWLSSDIGLLRNATDIKYTITDSRGRVVESHDFYYEDCEKTFYYINGQFVVTLSDVEYQYGDFNGTGLRDGSYTMTISGYAAEGRSYQSTSFDFYVDNRAPRIIGSDYNETEEGRLILDTRAYDNRALQGIDLNMVLETEDGRTVGANVDDMARHVTVLYQDGIIDRDTYSDLMESIPQPIINENGQAIDWDITSYKHFAETFAPYIMYIYGEGVTLNADYIAQSAIDYAWNISEYKLVKSEKPAGDINIIVRDQMRKAVAGAVVDINGTEYTTDSNGAVYLKDMDLGLYVAKIVSVPKGYMTIMPLPTYILLRKDGETVTRNIIVLRSFFFRRGCWTIN